MRAFMKKLKLYRLSHQVAGSDRSCHAAVSGKKKARHKGRATRRGMKRHYRMIIFSGP